MNRGETFFFFFCLFRIKPPELKISSKTTPAEESFLRFTHVPVEKRIYRHVKTDLKVDLSFNVKVDFFLPPVQQTTCLHAERCAGRHDYRYLPRWCSKEKGVRFQFPVNVNVQL